MGRVTYAPVVDAAAQALRQTWKSDVDLALADVVVDYPRAAAVLLRARVLRGPAELPPTVVVKRSNAGEGVEMEWAGLAFAAELPSVRPFVPRLLAGEAGERVLVISDLDGPGVRRVGDLLFDPPGGQAEAALVAAQTLLGRLHAAALGKREVYERIRAERGRAKASRHPVHKLESQLAGLPRIIGDHVEQPAALRRQVEQEVQAVARELFEPGPFTTLTHGDPTVGNLLYSPAAGVKLIDFETAGYRHALLDGCFARLRYLYSVWAHQVPEAVQRRLLAAYRAELADGCPQAGDDAVFSRALLAGCAAWLAGLCSHLPRVSEADARWGRVTFRQRIVAGLGHFAAVAEEYGQFPALGDSARLLRDRLRNEWPAADRTLPVYPALAAS